jgi:DNA-directed RNA polymerase subunit L
MSNAEVVRVTIERNELTAEKVPALRDLFRLERLPLAESHVEIEIRGVSTAVVNALRRVVTDEMPGYALQVPVDGFDASETSEVFMLPQFTNQRIALLPLRGQIPADVVEKLRLELDVANRGTSPLSVYAGDLVVKKGRMAEPLFNPTFKLCVLQPGKRIVIRGIYIATGAGRDNGVFLVARRAAYRHLDIAQHDRAATHDPGGEAADWSGYKVSSLVADPRHHLLTATLAASSPDPSEARAVFADACANIKERLRLVATTVERRAEAGSLTGRGVQYTVVELEAGLTEGILQVPGETHTIGALLCRAIYEFAPNIANVAYTIVAHENRMNLTLRSTEDVTQILLGAARNCITTFDTIQRGIMRAR